MAENTIANRTLFIADNLDVLRGMNSGTIDLIYLDPPFNSGKEWSARVGSRIMTIEQLRAETTKKGTHVSCGEKTI